MLDAIVNEIRPNFKRNRKKLRISLLPAADSNLNYNAGMKNTFLLSKTEALAAFGGSVAATARAMGYKTVSTVYNWPNTLSLETSDRVRGAWLRTQASDQAPAPRPTRPVKRHSWLVRRSA